MFRTCFNDDWLVRPKVNPFTELSGPAVPFTPVAVPHDAMIHRQRVAPPEGVAAIEAGAGAYFPGGAVEYRKTFAAPEELSARRVLIEFEGVYRDAVVYVNGDYAGQRPSGYAGFRVDVGPLLRPGQDNEIRVEARSHRDSRWYSGCGIYRDVWLLSGGPVHIEPDGVRVTTPDVDAERAVVEIDTRVANHTGTVRTVEVRVEIRSPAGVVVAAEARRLTVLPGEPGTARQRLYVRAPRLWGPDHPMLYTCGVELRADEERLDREEVRFGIRTLRLDPDHGLRLNGETVKLRGACIHHDNGVLGAATFGRAEERRVQLLKAAGFNAVRMAHHPASRALLDACDRLGMLVMDEAFDQWTIGKSEFDYSLSFPEWWERDIEAMVAKDRNHPSVVLYSIGNEVPEAGSPVGAVWGRRLAEKVRALDPTRYTTNSVNSLVAVMADLAAWRGVGEAAEPDDTGTGGVNTLMAGFGAAINALAASDLATERTAESFAAVDVAGMNYSDSRYALDKDLFPSRIIVGAETFPTRIDVNWALVQQHSHVIGDFTWTGWDYLGEVGIGRPQYADSGTAPQALTASYPYLVAGCGDIDLTGARRPQSYYREIVFGLRDRPYIAVLRPEHHGKTFTGTPWAWSDSVASWTWPGHEGAPVSVEVYSDADEVELRLNGQLIGRRPVGAAHRFRAVFETVYTPGDLVAVAYRGGIEVGRDALATATGPVVLGAEADRPVIAAAGGDLAFLDITLTDAAGTVYTGADRPVGLEVSGAGVLQGFGSAAPSTEERFDAAVRRTHDGRALAVLRPTGAGKIRVVASAPDCEPVEVLIAAE